MALTPVGCALVGWKAWLLYFRRGGRSGDALVGPVPVVSYVLSYVNLYWTVYAYVRSSFLRPLILSDILKWLVRCFYEALLYHNPPGPGLSAQILILL